MDVEGHEYWNIHSEKIWKLFKFVNGEMTVCFWGWWITYEVAAWDFSARHSSFVPSTPFPQEMKLPWPWRVHRPIWHRLMPSEAVSRTCYSFGLQFSSSYKIILGICSLSQLDNYWQTWSSQFFAFFERPFRSIPLDTWQRSFWQATIKKYSWHGNQGCSWEQRGIESQQDS